MTRTSTTDEQQPVFIPKRLIQEARDGSSIDIHEIHAFLEGSKEKSKAVRDMMRELAGDPFISSGTEYYEHNKVKARLETVKKIGRLALYLENDVKRARREYKKDVIKDLQEGNAAFSLSKDFEIFDRRMSLLAVVDPQLCTRVGINLTLFGNCVKGNGTDEQIKYWLQESGLLFLRGIYGCFAMTELGHGSNVMNIQTLSTYNPSSDTFTITTPDLVATKWWIGGAAHSATHAAVYARLLVEERDYGVKTFVVPLRDPKTMELKAGITIGDIGAKMGRDGIDNGWIQFHDVVIPREYMLSRFTKVIPGNPPRVEVNEMLDSVSGYAALLSGRVSMTLESYRVGSRFATIATRYAFGRQQFGERGNENQLIDYPLHQYRIIPHIALPYLVAPMAQKLFKNYNDTLNALYSAKNDKKKLMDVSARLKNLFVDSAALKATGTWLVATEIDELRQSCGGHGYSSYNGFAKGYGDWVVQCTWEGDNNVLCLSCGNSLLKRFMDAVKGKKASDVQPTSSYLELGFIQKALTTNADEIIKFSNNANYYQLWAVILVCYLKHCAEIVRATKNPDTVSKPLVSVAKFHALHAMLQEFHRKLSSDDNEVSDGITRDVLWKVYQLASLYYIDKFSGEVLQLKVLSPDQMSEIIQPRIISLLQDLKPHCIKLTDAFHFPDAIINSPIGYYDGDIYHNYFTEVTKNAPQDSAPGAADYAPLLANVLGRDFESARYGGASEDVFERLGK